jgi:FHA domain-containing protein
MSVLRTIEHTIEGIVERTFGRAFRSHLQPVELARKLAREMEENKTVSVSQVYVPNEYTVYLSPHDRERFASFEASLTAELAAYLAAYARGEGLALLSQPEVVLTTDEALRVGEFGIACRTVDPPEYRAEEPAPAEEAVPAAAPAAPAAAEPEGPALDGIVEEPPDEAAPPEGELDVEEVEAALGGMEVPAVPVAAAAAAVAASPEAGGEDADAEAPLPADGEGIAPFAETVAAVPAVPAPPAPAVPAQAPPAAPVAGAAAAGAAAAGALAGAASDAAPPRPAPERPRPPVRPPANQALQGVSGTQILSADEARAAGLTREALTLTVGGRRLRITKRVTTIGRSRDNDLVVGDPNVSRQHAEIRHVGIDYYLVDLGSTNGIEVNGRRTKRHALAHGDVIMMGRTQIRVESG